MHNLQIPPPIFCAFLPKMHKKYHSFAVEGVYFIKTQFCISSRQSLVSHQSAGLYQMIWYASPRYAASLRWIACRGSRQKITDTGSVIFVFLLSNDTATLNALNDLILQEYICNDKRYGDKDCSCSCNRRLILR